jgi:adenylate cyclase, class 2
MTNDQGRNCFGVRGHGDLVIGHFCVMHYEVEQKYRCNDLDRVRERLLALGAAAGESAEQSDCYFKHPVRDFAKTDEAFRLRRVGDRNFLTYKGPKIDATTKSRHEEEVRLADGESAHRTCAAILRHLGFESVAEVNKRRRTLQLERDGLSVEAALDEVERVGSFVELEISVDAANDDKAEIETAKRVLADLAKQLGLGPPERRSYLELLLLAGPNERDLGG